MRSEQRYILNFHCNKYITAAGVTAGAFRGRGAAATGPMREASLSGLLYSPLIRIDHRLTITASAAYNKSDRDTDIRGLDRAVLKEKEDIKCKIKISYAPTLPLRTVRACSLKRETVSYAADCREKTNAAATGPACAFTMNLYKITENARSRAQKNASWYQT